MKQWALILALITPAAWANPSITPGQWQIEMKMEIPGMPKGQSFTTEWCYDEAMVKDIAQNMPKPGQMMGHGKNAAQVPECKYLKQDIQGNKLSYSMECTSPQGKMTMNGNMEFNPSAYQGKIDMIHEGGSMGKMTMHQEIKAKRLGDCKKEAAK